MIHFIVFRWCKQRLICIPSIGCPWFRWLTDFKDTSYIVPSVFQCVLDMDAGTLGFMADGQWLGTAFSGHRLYKHKRDDISRYCISYAAHNVTHIIIEFLIAFQKVFRVKHFTQLLAVFGVIVRLQ